MKQNKTLNGEMTKLKMIVDDTLSFCRANNVQLKDIFTLLQGEQAKHSIETTITQAELPFKTTEDVGKKLLEKQQ